jgi:hypothetical protein
MAAATAKIIGKCQFEQLVFDDERLSREEKVGTSVAKLNRVAPLIVESSGSRKSIGTPFDV